MNIHMYVYISCIYTCMYIGVRRHQHEPAREALRRGREQHQGARRRRRRP